MKSPTRSALLAAAAATVVWGSDLPLAGAQPFPPPPPGFGRIGRPPPPPPPPGYRYDRGAQLEERMWISDVGRRGYAPPPPPPPRSFRRMRRRW